MKKSIFTLMLGASSLLSSFTTAENYLFFSPQAIESHLNGYNEDEKAAVRCSNNLTHKNKMPYTLVLAPPATQALKYVETSQALYGDYQLSYLLTADGSSSPHITVVQFDCDSPDLANEVWMYVCDKMREEKFEPFEPPFTGMSFIDGTGPYEGTTWVELSVKRGAENSPIMKVHYAALEALKRFNLEPLNATCNNYRPHLTLARIIMPEQMKVWSKNFYANPGNFNLEFGLSDEKWQYAQNLGIFSGGMKK